MSKVEFAIAAGPDAGKVFEIEEGTGKIFGRHQEAHYRVTDPRVSRRHFEVQCVDGQVKIVDYGSTGGTYVNGTRIMERVVKPGDTIQVGDTQILVRGEAPASLLEATSHPAELLGQTIAHFQVGDVIGVGASGMVFKATDLNSGKEVALKIMHPEFSRDEAQMQRFVLAMKAMMPLRHPNIVQVFGAGRAGPYCWMAMELIIGENMAEVLERIGVAGMLDWKYAFRVAVHIGRALQYAHSRSIIHRNITPTNILMEKATKTAKLGDLMLARATQGALAQHVTRPGQLIGEVNYMSPERTRGNDDQIDGRSDLFSLGATVYALLTGRPPFKADNMLDTITNIRHVDPDPPSKFQMGIPGQLEGVVMKLLAKKPEDRYQSADEMLVELERIGKFCGVEV